jgi:hypothetical protein
MTPNIASLTDFFNTALCMIFCWKLWDQPADKKKLNFNFLGLFASIGVASLLGGVVHAINQPSSDLVKTLWLLTILNVGVSSYNIWIINMRLLLPDSLFRYGSMIGRLFFVVFALFVIFVNRQFFVAIVSYMPPAILLFFILLTRSLRERNRFYFLGLMGLVLTFVAAAIQHFQWGIEGLGLDNNSLYHLVQALGLVGIYLFGSRVSRWSL